MPSFPVPPLMDRRRFVKGAALAATLPRLLSRAGAQDQAPALRGATTTLNLPGGRLRGHLENQVRVFRGVPFAKPPVGPLRFRPPEEPAAWSGVRDALQFASAAPQPNKPRLPQSEDCLYLNVWAPIGPGPYPVFVWIHGGGFTNGDSFDPSQNGAHFADAGIVCVTVAYRLGALGFLNVEPLLGSKYEGSANNGLRDLLQALRWVQGNIHAFGGDPGRVTVGGESAGAKLTDTLMGVPAAGGLFRQMVSESGGAERVWSQAEAASVGRGFGAAWTASGRPTAGLLTAGVQELITVQKQFTHSWPKHFPLRPALDGDWLPQLPVKTIAGGSTRGKRLLLGTNLDESALFVGPDPGPPGASELGNLPLAQFERVLARYRDLEPRWTDARLRIRALTAEEYWVPSIRVVDAHLRGGGGPAYVYRLEYAPKDGRLRGDAYHSEDVRMVWDDTHGGPDDAAAETALAAQMHGAWCSFIRGDAPAAPGLPPWPAYNTSTRPTLLLNEQSRVAENPDGAQLALWQGVL